MYVSLYHDPQSLGSTCGLVPQSFDGNEIETFPAGSELFPSRQSVYVEGKTHVRIVANVRNVPQPLPGQPPQPLTLSLEYSRDGGTTWRSANASVTFDVDGNRRGEWEALPAQCYSDVIFRAVKEDAGGVACTIVSVAMQLR